MVCFILDIKTVIALIKTIASVLLSPKYISKNREVFVHVFQDIKVLTIYKYFQENRPQMTVCRNINATYFFYFLKIEPSYLPKAKIVLLSNFRYFKFKSKFA